MPSETEAAVLKMLSAIEISPALARRIERQGNEAVTALCEIALGVPPGLRMKVRTNATALLDKVDHPQARETLELLLSDPNEGVRIRALRAAGRAKMDAARTRLVIESPVIHSSAFRPTRASCRERT